MSRRTRALKGWLKKYPPPKQCRGCTYWCINTKSCDYSLITGRLRTIEKHDDGTITIDLSVNEHCPCYKKGSHGSIAREHLLMNEWF